MSIDESRSRGRTEAVLAVLAGEKTEAEVADGLGVAVEEVNDWKEIYLAAARGAVAVQSPPRTRRFGTRARATALAGVALLVVSLTAGVLSALPPELVEFQAGEPARASDMNSNFEWIVTWLGQKLEPGDLTISGEFSVNSYIGGTSTSDTDTVSTGINAANGICFLTRHSHLLQDDASFTNWQGGSCTIVNTGGVWHLTSSVWAELQNENDSVYCRARCLTWQ